MVILVNGGIATGKSTLWRLAPQTMRPLFGRVAALDLEELFRMTNPEVTLSDPHWLGDWLLARRHAALLTDSFLAREFDAVLITGPFFTAEEIQSYRRWLAVSPPIYHFTLRISLAEMKSRIRRRGDPDKPPAWIDRYFRRLQAFYQPWMEVIDVGALPPQAILQSIAHQIAQGFGRLPDQLPDPPDPLLDVHTGHPTPDSSAG